MPTLKLKSSEGDTVECEAQVAKLSKTIKTMLDDLNIEDDEVGEVPLPKVNTSTLKLVVEWCTHHISDYDELIDENSDRPYYDMSDWDTNFLKVDQRVLFELLSASNYLDIKGLLLLTCKAVALQMKGKTVAQIREHFGIEDDFGPEDREQVRKEIEWLEEN